MVVLVLLVAMTVLVFLPVGHHDFIIFDDDAYVSENPWIRQGLTAAGLRWACTSVGYGANWHPLTWVSHMLDVEFFGLAPRGHHLANLALHAAAAALLFFALVSLTGALWRSALVAALFAVHPLRLESVAWVAERKDVLVAFFWCLTLLLYARYARAPSPARYLFVVVSFTAGLLSKPMMVTLPFVLLLLDWWPLGRLGDVLHARSRRAGQVSFLQAIVEKLPFFALSAAAVMATYAAQKTGGGIFVLKPFPVPVRVANALWSVLIYLKKTALPYDLAVFYPHPGFGLSWWKSAFAAAVLAGLTVVALAWYRRRPVFLVGWAWYLGTLVPVLGLVQFGAQGMADRYTYLPLIGVFLAAAHSLPGVSPGTARARRTAIVGAAAAVAACAILTRLQIGYWQDSRTLFTRALAVTDDNWMAENFVGISLMDEGKPAAAEGHFARAAAIRPDYWKAPYNLGNSLLARRKPDAAAAAYRQAIRINPGSAAAYNNLGVAYLGLGRTEEARRSFLEALRVQPGFPDAQRNLEDFVANR